MSTEYGRSRRQDEHEDELPDMTEANIDEEAYITWNENGKDASLEDVREQYRQTRDLDDSDPEKPGWVKAIQAKERQRL